MVPVLEGSYDLVQRRQPSGHRAEQGLEETGGGEFAGIADDQPALACDQIKVGHERPAGSVFDMPSLPVRSPGQSFNGNIFSQIAVNQQFMR